MNLLCVCTGNTCRSPMLEALLRSAFANAKQPVQVRSAGTGAGSGEPASPGSQRAMRRRGLSLDQHRSRQVDEVDLTTIDRFLCMTSSHAAALRARGVPATKIQVVNAAAGGVPDPFGGSDQDYEATAQVLELAAREIAAGG